MRKTIMTMIALFGIISGAEAQTWEMVITHEDGTRDTMQTSAVKNVSFFLPDQNADQMVIKEIYNGGCPKDDGSGYFHRDKCIILYNNCPQPAVLNNLCIAMSEPNNSQSVNTNYGDDGALVYESEGFIPAQNAIWYFPNALVIQPYSQVVVNICGAIDNTQTYSQSVNYANKDYYCMYDPESGFDQTSYYPTPSDVIPASHYLKAAKYGEGTAWPFSVWSPAVFIFQTSRVTPLAFGLDADRLWYSVGAAQTAMNACIKVPAEWIIDGVEVYSAAYDENQKRLTADIDAGYVKLTNKLGHSLYRNVDKEATLAIDGNAEKLVYNYSLGVDGSTDPSGIDAEASMKNGAKIVFLDTNNSSSDFHERQKCSLRD